MAYYNRDYYDYPYTTTYSYWWGSPYGWSDYDLYDYNNNFILDDDEIEDIVRDNIAGDPGITWSDMNKIDIKVKNGTVTLSGEVRNPRTKPLAYSDAYWSSGVIEVNNEITVKKREQRERTEGRQSQRHREEDEDEIERERSPRSRQSRR